MQFLNVWRPSLQSKKLSITTTRSMYRIVKNRAYTEQNTVTYEV